MTFSGPGASGSGARPLRMWVRPQRNCSVVKYFATVAAVLVVRG
ncbi:hypothetical protein EV644_101203 [Kribbella orskensis]|uniref:Uncharacterized protein n=1 Tax=Kribbella orskensis TaxID=2512216 RepID=A0ABY2BWV7_9ACTN|nr:hypothetical protein EV642_101786 [Kribbella sp. VKM Ac-2500]TCO31563.1 hypothetical protein EV644_101203 [Kribbella orskensis]